MHDDTALLIEVCSIDSIWGKERELAEFLADQLTAWNCDEVQLVESRPDRPSVGARLKGTGGGRSLVLNGHLDIYELSEDWTRDPFAAALQDGKVYGAGIADMKAGTAAAAAAVRRIAASDRRLRGDVVFQGVSCHFEGGVGTRSLCAAGFVGDAAIDCEPSSNTIGIAHRGAAYLKITTKGRQAHTTYKHLGVNAIETMEPILAGLRELESSLPYEPHPLLPGGPILNIGTISGGTKHNQVPDRCIVTLDIRLLPSQDPHDVKRQVEDMIAGLRSSVDSRIDATVEFSEYWLSGPRHPYEISPDAPIVQSLDRAVRAVTATEPVYRGVPFWCDLVALDQFGVKGVNFGPGDPPYNFPDEYVYEAQYLQAVDVYEQLIREYCQ
ncbi:MAG: M20/M25/M40 family metallo-hydrolase [Ilumatobacteraceae bacterium]|nr:M20/M25/M40 family metallo-hydrolase [Ilumatobacteraceae bacterium]